MLFQALNSSPCHTVVEAPISEEMLLRTNENGQLVMTITRLGEIIQDWLARVDQTYPSALVLWVERVQKGITEDLETLWSNLDLLRVERDWDVVAFDGDWAIVGDAEFA
ncbi:hypothetical protein QBC36DRAFT_111421 [Triangularia setosa]|uniref:Uncharacterized protein n=1 Tax=Triangularia setosa TaxID=2587417 RepID=A0AAN7A1S5_9PEZI|nr:hypothetical protein QBC36DRAFT_111421 [Podospora setosa]